jgi:SET domain-containing protein
MEIKENKEIGGKGIYATKKYAKTEIIYTLTGEEFDHPTRETIYVGDGKHIYDSYGIFMNHSFEPNCLIVGHDIVALKDINIDDELTFDYNLNEPEMAAPFVVDNKLVSGKEIKKPSVTQSK